MCLLSSLQSCDLTKFLAHFLVLDLYDIHLHPITPSTMSRPVLTPFQRGRITAPRRVPPIMSSDNATFSQRVILKAKSVDMSLEVHQVMRGCGLRYCASDTKDQSFCPFVRQAAYKMTLK